MIKNWLAGFFKKLFKRKVLTLSEQAKKFAIKAHRRVRHKYGKQPYKVHLQAVVNEGEQFISLIPFADRETVRAAEWLHDTVEDCRITYNDLKKLFGKTVADIVYACTNEKGKNRDERANDKFYKELKLVQYADFVKSMDRAANMKNSKREGSSMYNKYCRELPNFIKKVYNPEYHVVFDYLNTI